MHDTASLSTTDYEVLIVGAGPVGLASAIELGQRGIRVCLIEAQPRVGNAPRAKTTNVRTCEHLRRWGMIERFRARAPFGVDYPSTICFATRLEGGYSLSSFDNAFYCRPGQNPLYAEHAQWIPQYKLEEVLKEQVLTLPTVEFRLDCKLLTLHDAGDSVQAEVEQHGVSQTLSATYAIGADGARSKVREQIGVRMSGDGGLSRNRVIIFRQPRLADMHKRGPAVMYWLVNGDTPVVMGPLDTGDLWYIGAPTASMQDDPAEIIRRATGLDITPEILSVGDWEAHRLIADSYRKGRIFLAGDACHLHPPYGGYGMNLGIGDAVDLGWKLAARLQGWGGELLLDSYQAERRPVHRRVIEEAVINHSVRTTNLATEHLEEDSARGAAERDAVSARILESKLREFRTLGVVLGYRYTDSPVIVYDAGQPPAEHYTDYVPSAYPGSRAPHQWLRDDCGPGASLYDHFGRGYTLLYTRTDAAKWGDVPATAAALGIPLACIAPGLPSLEAAYEAAYVLIRPDQHVAWRGPDLPADMAALLLTLTGQTA